MSKRKIQSQPTPVGPDNQAGIIRIRMYNVGFGDCFLLSLPGKRTVLVDAGFDETRESELARITAPVLITWDETDVVIPVARASQLQRAIPGSQLVTWGDRQRDPDADPQNRHWSQMSHSREWNRAVSEFLRQT